MFSRKLAQDRQRLCAIRNSRALLLERLRALEVDDVEQEELRRNIGQTYVDEQFILDRYYGEDEHRSLMLQYEAMHVVLPILVFCLELISLPFSLTMFAVKLAQLGVGPAYSWSDCLLPFALPLLLAATYIAARWIALRWSK